MRVESNISRNAPADGQQEHWDGEASTGHVLKPGELDLSHIVHHYRFRFGFWRKIPYFIY